VLEPKISQKKSINRNEIFILHQLLVNRFTVNRLSFRKNHSVFFKTHIILLPTSVGFTRLILKTSLDMKHILYIFLLLVFVSCSIASPKQENTKPISHATFDALLKKHVNKEGWVNYEGFKEDRAELKKYLDLIQNNAPNDKTWSKEDRLAYWINAYNAFTIELILQYYPVESIKDIGSKIQIPFVNTPWDIKFIKIGGKEMDLNNIEHSILRKEFNEPRIHFAVNCASYSCPVLRAEDYTGAKIEQQLKEQAISFVNDERRNKISSTSAQLSKLFDWYSGDFTENKNLKDFINQFAKVKIADKTKVSYIDYDWRLNDSKDF
jgi:hypothetical protein